MCVSDIVVRDSKRLKSETQFWSRLKEKKLCFVWHWRKKEKVIFLLLKTHKEDKLGAVVTPGILSRVFLFYIKKILSHIGCFRKYRPKFKIWPAWSLCFKKKKVLKTKKNLHSVHRKTSKGKKNEKKRNEQSYLYNKP